MTLIRERGELVAVVGQTRAYLLPHVERRSEADLLRRRTLAKCLYALAIATGRRPGPYRELEAEAFACRISAAPAGWRLRLGRPRVARLSRAVGGRTQPRPARRPDGHRHRRADDRTPPASRYLHRRRRGAHPRRQRTEGVVQISDVPADGRGRSYLLEPEVGSMAELRALVADYLAKAKKLGWVPMHGW